MESTLKKLRQKIDMLNVCAKHTSTLDIHGHINIANKIDVLNRQITAIQRTHKQAA